jgi:hypothetical protein
MDSLLELSDFSGCLDFFYCVFILGLKFFSCFINELSGSVAVNEVQIKCGICLKHYCSRNTERTVQGKVNYFKSSKLSDSSNTMQCNTINFI